MRIAQVDCENVDMQKGRKISLELSSSKNHLWEVWFQTLLISAWFMIKYQIPKSIEYRIGNYKLKIWVMLSELSTRLTAKDQITIPCYFWISSIYERIISKNPKQ